MRSWSAGCGSSVGARRVAIDGRAGQGERGGQVLRLLQRQRAAEEHPVTPRPRAAARPEGRLPAPRRGAAGRGRRGRTDGARAPHRRPGRHRAEGTRRPTAGSPRRCGGRGRSSCYAHLEVEAEQRLRELAEAEAIRVFGRNLHDLLLAAPAGQRDDDGARSRASGPASRSRSWTAPARCSRPRRSTRTSRARTGRARSARWRRSATGTASSSISIGNGTASRETDALAARADRHGTRSWR